MLHLELFQEHQTKKIGNLLPTIDYSPLRSEYPVLDPPSDSNFSMIVTSACLNSESSAHCSDQLEDSSWNCNTSLEHRTLQPHFYSVAENEPGSGEDKSSSGREESGSGKDKFSNGGEESNGGKQKPGTGKEKHGNGRPGARKSKPEIRGVNEEVNEEENSDAKTDEIDEVQSKDDDMTYLGIAKLQGVRLQNQVTLSDLYLVCLASLL